MKVATILTTAALVIGVISSTALVSLAVEDTALTDSKPSTAPTVQTAGKTPISNTALFLINPLKIVLDGGGTALYEKADGDTIKASSEFIGKYSAGLVYNLKAKDVIENLKPSGLFANRKANTVVNSVSFYANVEYGNTNPPDAGQGASKHKDKTTGGLGVRLTYALCDLFQTCPRQQAGQDSQQ